jgi:hypothetical protein
VRLKNNIADAQSHESYAVISDSLHPCSAWYIQIWQPYSEIHLAYEVTILGQLADVLRSKTDGGTEFLLRRLYGKICVPPVHLLEERNLGVVT